MKKVSIAIIMTLFFHMSLSAQMFNVPKTTKQIETYLTELEKVGFSGAVLIALDGEEVLSKGYGYRNLELKEKNTPKTIFDIGSLTKQFTASAILKLEMQGKLQTTDTITRYFQNVPEDKSAITIHDLLRHQTGLPSGVGDDYDAISEADFVETVMKATLQFPMGTDFSYSNVGYSLLSLIVEKVSGQTYEQYLYENLWKPSGMETTGYSRPNFNSDLIAVGYGRYNRIWGKPTSKNWNGNEPYLNLKGNGGILSTTEDLMQWHKALMGSIILSREAKEKLYHPQIRANETEKAYYAYGWDVSKTDRNTTRVWHNGSNNIFYADFMRFIDENTTLIMMSNKSNPSFDNLNFELSKIIFEKNYKPSIPVADNEDNQKFSQEIIDVVLSKGLEEAKLKYKKRPSKTDVLEYDLLNKAYELLSQNKYDSAIGIFTINSMAYPKSSYAFESLGESYMNKGDKAMALKNYKKSLQLDPTNENAENMIKKLKQ